MGISVIFRYAKIEKKVRDKNGIVNLSLKFPYSYTLNYWIVKNYKLKICIHIILMFKYNHLLLKNAIFGKKINMKTTAFKNRHEAFHARMIEFAGYLMPVEYIGINDEHTAVRQGVGVFDVSHMGEFWVSGANALPFIQHITTNDVASLATGQAQYSCFPNGKGGIVDDLLVYCFDSEKYLLVVNASNIEKDWQWCNTCNTFGAILENASDSVSQLAIQGPKAIEVLQKLTDIDLTAIKYYHFTVGTICGISDVIISATGYTGAGGFELYMKNEDALTVWDAIFAAGESAGIMPIGLGARDTLRLEMGYCLYGNDIDDTTSPIEAGLGWITKFAPEKQFIDMGLYAQQLKEGISRKLQGFVMIDRGIPRHGYEIVDQQGNKIGEVTSGTMSPMLKQGIGMGYINPENAKTGKEIFINIRNKMLKAIITRPPFYKSNIKS